MKSIPLFSCSILIFLVACAGSKSTTSNSTYDADVGTATSLDVKDKGTSFLDRQQYQVLRQEETTELIYMETHWRFRSPFEDEVELGVEEARTRIFLRATPRGMRQQGIFSDISSVKLTAENQVRYRGETTWRDAHITPKLRSYLRKLSDDLSIAFRTGIRKF
jgi:hypothetical protein